MFFSTIWVFVFPAVNNGTAAIFLSGWVAGRGRHLADVTRHVFRHTYISHLVMAGVDIRAVQELAWHRDISMTARYAHSSADHKLTAVAKLSSFREKSEAARLSI